MGGWWIVPVLTRVDEQISRNVTHVSGGGCHLSVEVLVLCTLGHRQPSPPLHPHDFLVKYVIRPPHAVSAVTYQWRIDGRHDLFECWR